MRVLSHPATFLYVELFAASCCARPCTVLRGAGGALRTQTRAAAAITCADGGCHQTQDQQVQLAAAAMVNAQRANLCRGLSLGLLPALEALARAAARGQPTVEQLVAGGLTPPPPVFAILAGLTHWEMIEHVLLAAPLQQVVPFVVSASKLGRRLVVVMTRPIKHGSKAHRKAALLALRATSAQVPPLEFLMCLGEASDDGSSCGGGDGTDLFGGAGRCADSSAPAAAQQWRAQQPGARKREQRAELVSLLLASWLPGGTSQAILAMGQALQSRGGEPADICTDTSTAVLEWVPVLVLAHLLALERGDTKAVTEWKAFIVVDLNIIGLLTCSYRPGDLREHEERAVACAALAVSAAFPDVMRGQEGQRLRANLKRQLPQPVCQWLARVWEAGEAGAGACVEVLVGLRRSAGHWEEPVGAPVKWDVPPPDDVALLPTPAEVRRRLGLCASGDCVEVVGDSEADVRLTVVCRGCRQARYCSERCASKHRETYSRRGFTAC